MDMTKMQSRKRMAGLYELKLQRRKIQIFKEEKKRKNSSTGLSIFVPKQYSLVKHLQDQR